MISNPFSVVSPLEHILSTFWAAQLSHILPASSSVALRKLQEQLSTLRFGILEYPLANKITSWVLLILLTQRFPLVPPKYRKHLMTMNMKLVPLSRSQFDLEQLPIHFIDFLVLDFFGQKKVCIFWKSPYFFGAEKVKSQKVSRLFVFFRP